MTEKHSGLTRTYLPTFNLNAIIPSIEEIDSRSEIGNLFINHVTKNHKGLNWKIYRYTLNQDNYKSFMLAFAITALESNPFWSTSWQFVSCARRMKKAMQRNNIILSTTEQNLLQNCINFQSSPDIKKRREQKYSGIIVELKKQYLG